MCSDGGGSVWCLDRFLSVPKKKSLCTSRLSSSSDNFIARNWISTATATELNVKLNWIKSIQNSAEVCSIKFKSDFWLLQEDWHTVFNLQNWICWLSLIRLCLTIIFICDSTRLNMLAPASEPARNRACLISISEAPQKYTCATHSIYGNELCVTSWKETHMKQKCLCSTADQENNFFLHS